MFQRILSAVFLFGAVLSMSAQHPSADGGVPAYNKTPPAKSSKQPPILTAEALWGENGGPAQVHAYALAAKIPDTLHQLPCYCNNY